MDNKEKGRILAAKDVLGRDVVVSMMQHIGGPGSCLPDLDAHQLETMARFGDAIVWAYRKGQGHQSRGVTALTCSDPEPWVNRMREPDDALIAPSDATLTDEQPLTQSVPSGADIQRSVLPPLPPVTDTSKPAPVTNGQVGGSHYQQFAIQPFEIAERNGLSFLEGSAVKRLHRHSRGGKGVEDLRKAVHELRLLALHVYNEDI